jgi:very-short-patch-repair endonuclease
MPGGRRGEAGGGAASRRHKCAREPSEPRHIPRPTRAHFPATIAPMPRARSKPPTQPRSLTKAPSVDGPKTQGRVEFSAHQHGRDGEIARICHEQQGLITLEQLEAQGLTVQAVHERLTAGRLHRIHQRVYSLTPDVMTERGRFMAAVLACGPEAVLSHRSAAYLWGLVDEWQGPIDVTAPNRRGRSPAGVRAHRDGSLQPIDKTMLHGVPCTSLARTLLEYAGVAPEWELRKAVAQAEVLGILDRAAMRSVLRRGRRRRGVARLCLIIETLHPQTKRTRSELERLFLTMCVSARLPHPEVNIWLEVPGGNPLQADFLWRDARLIVEADSHEFHGTASAFESDRKREQRFQLAAWRVSRCTWAQVEREPRRLATTIRALLAQDPPTSTSRPEAVTNS